MEESGYVNDVFAKTTSIVVGTNYYILRTIVFTLLKKPCGIQGKKRTSVCCTPFHSRIEGCYERRDGRVTFSLFVTADFGGLTNFAMVT
jgi:hypothetical protein